MVRNRTLPAASMKLTPQRSTLNLSRGEAARRLRQHSSRAATHWPTSRPSTLSTVLPRFFSVVILSMVHALVIRQQGGGQKVCILVHLYPYHLFRVSEGSEVTS